MLQHAMTVVNSFVMSRIDFVIVYWL